MSARPPVVVSGIAEHDADLFANLVDEDQARARFRDHAGQFAQGLRHQPRLHAHVAVAHFAFQFGLGHQRRHRIHHQHVDLAGSDQGAGDFERLFAIIRLRNQQVVDIHAELFRIGRIERVFHVDEGGHAARLLGFGDDLQRDGGFARRFRPEDLVDSAARKSAHAQGGIERDATGRNHRHRHDRILRSEPQNRALAKLLLDLAQGQIQGACALLLVHVGFRSWKS